MCALLILISCQSVSIGAMQLAPILYMNIPKRVVDCARASALRSIFHRRVANAFVHHIKPRGARVFGVLCILCVCCIWILFLRSSCCCTSHTACITPIRPSWILCERARMHIWPRQRAPLVACVCAACAAGAFDWFRYVVDDATSALLAAAHQVQGD